MPQFIIKHKYLIITILGTFTMIFQAFFMYKVSTSPRKRNLIIITKSPMQVISRWDTADYYNQHPEDVSDNIIRLVREVARTEYKEYKFNENTIVKITTLDVKTDNDHTRIETSKIKPPEIESLISTKED